MATSAAPSGSFALGGDLTVTRLGYGAMRITGKGVWGDPPDRERALTVLRMLPELGVDFIDTADSYGPDVSEHLIREALHPYDGLTVATKAGLTRQGPDQWRPVGRPEYLRQCCLMSLRRLDVECIDLFQLHRIDAKVPREEQFGVLADLQSEGLVRHLGLSEASVDDVEEASRYFRVTAVQNRYNVADRADEEVVEHCAREGIGFIPWHPLAAGRLAEPGGAVAEVAERHGATPGQVALAWLLARSEVVLPIPGTGSPDHLVENVAAAQLSLGEDDVALLDRAGAPA